MEITTDRQDNKYFVIARKGDEVVGCAEVTSTSKSTFLLDHIESFPQKQGTGKQVLSKVEQLATEHGCVMIKTQAETDAIDFYKKMGFQIAPEETQKLKSMDLTWMYKQLK